MKSTIKICFIVLFILKDFAPTLTSDSTSEYDITNILNEAIIKTFQCVNPNAAMRLISHMENRGNSKYETRNNQRLHPFGNKIYFHDINISIWEPISTPKIFCEFHKNKTRIFNNELVFKVVGLVDPQPRKPYACFKTHMKFKDISISATESSTGPFNNQFQIHFSYKCLMYNYLTLPWTQENIPSNKQDKLIKRIKTIVPTMVHDNINHNEKFLHVLHSSYCHNPKQGILSAYPDFLLNEHQYYYLIPKVSFLGVNLVNVKIRGLSNFESLKPNITFGNSAYTLILKNIRGSMNLDNKEFEDLAFYEMNFNIGYLFITVDYETKRLVVEARDYNVTQTSTKPPRSSIFSTIIMQNIETAIASSIMPSLEVSGSNELDFSSITHNTDSSVIQMATKTSIKSDPTITQTTKKSSITQKATEPSTNSDPTTQTTEKNSITQKATEPSTNSDPTTQTTKSSTPTQKLRFTITLFPARYRPTSTRKLWYARLWSSTWHKSASMTTRRLWTIYSPVWVPKWYAFNSKTIKPSPQSNPTTRTTTSVTSPRITTLTPLRTDSKTSKSRFDSTTRAVTTSTTVKIATQSFPKTEIKTTQSRPVPTTQSTTSSTVKGITTHSPSTQYRESSTRQMITDTTKKSCTNMCNLIPQTDKTVINSTTEAEVEPFDYDISFHNVTIKLVSGSPYPKQIQCEFFKNLKIDHQINAIPSGNIRLHNKGNAININFHANFTAIKISVVKPGSNSGGNDSCEFQIHNNQDIKVILPSTKNTSRLNENLKIKNKIDQTLMSVVKERITRSVKPLVCFPFDFCSQSVQILDDFFQSFVDKVLKKCSLRRNTTS